MPASSTTLPPTLSLTPDPTLPSTLTPFPDGYLDSTWLIDIQRPDVWYSPDHLIKLSDETILAVGDIYSNQNKFGSWRHTTVWISRLTPTGNLIWIKYIPISGDDQFFPNTLSTGINNNGLLSGILYHPTGDGRLEPHRMTMSITDDGVIEWSKPLNSGYKQVLENGSILLQTGISSVSIINQQGEVQSQIELDFGPGYGQAYILPYPVLDIAHQLANGDWLFAGTIVDDYWGESSPDKSGYMEGNTAYWYARFSADGKPIWKHLHPIEPLGQSIRGLTINSDNQIVFSGTGRYDPLFYTWLRKVDQDGKTVFHKRYLNLPILQNALSPGGDGITYFWGRRSIPQGEHQPDLQIVSLAKVTQEGDLEWIRTFPNHYYIHAVLPLDDGSILTSFRAPDFGIALARIDANGMLPNCTAMQIESLERQVDINPARFDTGDQESISLTFPTPDAEEEITLPQTTLKSIDLPLTELCRSY